MEVPHSHDIATELTAGAFPSVEAAASADQALTTTMADVTGASISLTKNGEWLVLWSVAGDNLNTGTFEGRLMVDGSAVSPSVFAWNAAGALVLHQSKLVTISAQPKTAKIQVRMTAGTGNNRAAGSGIRAVWFGN